MKEGRGARRAVAIIALAVGLGLAGLAGPAEAIGGLSWAALASSLALTGLAVAMAASSPESLPAALGLARSRRPLGAAGLGLALAGTLALSHGLDLVLTSTGARETSVLGRLDAHLAGASPGALLGAALAMAVAPALGEEILFRGVLLKRLGQRLGALPGLLLSSMLFGAIHLDLAQGIAAASLGIYFGALALRTGSVHATVLCHGLNNLAAIFAAQSNT